MKYKQVPGTRYVVSRRGIVRRRLKTGLGVRVRAFDKQRSGRGVPKALRGRVNAYTGGGNRKKLNVMRAIRRAWGS